MTTITTKWNSGNFSMEHSVEATPEQVGLLAEKGLLWHMQRNREHDKVLGAFEKKGDKSVRKANWSRGDVDYSDGFALSLKAAYASFEVAKDQAMPVATTIVEYIRDVAEAKFTAEKEVFARHESKGDLEDWLATRIKFTGPTHTEDGEDYNPVALRAMRTLIAAEQKAKLDAI